jgi:hypothetical protein
MTVNELIEQLKNYPADMRGRKSHSRLVNNIQRVILDLPNLFFLIRKD